MVIFLFGISEKDFHVEWGSKGVASEKWEKWLWRWRMECLFIFPDLSHNHLCSQLLPSVLMVLFQSFHRAVKIWTTQQACSQQTLNKWTLCLLPSCFGYHTVNQSHFHQLLSIIYSGAFRLLISLFKIATQAPCSWHVCLVFVNKPGLWCAFGRKEACRISFVKAWVTLFLAVNSMLISNTY